MSRKRVKDFTHVSSKKYDGMMGRCYRTKDPAYKSHGGRGIKICSEWIKDIASFRLWLLKELESMDVSIEMFVTSPKTYSLDRSDVNGHYTPDNCRLVNMQMQARNKVKKAVHVVVSAEGEVIYV